VNPLSLIVVLENETVLLLLQWRGFYPPHLDPLPPGERGVRN